MEKMTPDTISAETLPSQDYKYGRFWIRFLAQIIDGILMLVIIMPILYMVYGSAYFTDAETMSHGVIDVILSYVFPIAATILFWLYRAGTPGKILLKLMIVNAKTGESISTGQAIGRYFAYILSAIPLGLGYIWAGFDKRKQSWHDKLAGTIVVYK